MQEYSVGQPKSTHFSRYLKPLGEIIYNCVTIDKFWNINEGTKPCIHMPVMETTHLKTNIVEK